MPKNLKRKSLDHVDDDDALDAADPQPVKKSKQGSSKSAQEKGKDADGNPFWPLSNKRRVGVSKFKNSIFINIREYYEADGELKPGKKGISLSPEQYQALVKAIPEINAELRKQGHTLEDPEDSEEVPAIKEPKKTSKSNIDATSDEDSE